MREQRTQEKSYYRSEAGGIREQLDRGVQRIKESTWGRQKSGEQLEERVAIVGGRRLAKSWAVVTLQEWGRERIFMGSANVAAYI